jgi:hypothetical protein
VKTADEPLQRCVWLLLAHGLALIHAAPVCASCSEDASFDFPRPRAIVGESQEKCHTRILIATFENFCSSRDEKTLTPLLEVQDHPPPGHEWKQHAPETRIRRSDFFQKILRFIPHAQFRLMNQLTHTRARSQPFEGYLSIPLHARAPLTLDKRIFCFPERYGRTFKRTKHVKDVQIESCIHVPANWLSNIPRELPPAQSAAGDEATDCLNPHPNIPLLARSSRIF